MLYFEEICLLINEYLNYKDHIEDWSQWNKIKFQTDTNISIKYELKQESLHEEVDNSNISLNVLSQNLCKFDQKCKYSHLETKFISIDDDEQNSSGMVLDIFFRKWLFSLEFHKNNYVQKRRMWLILFSKYSHNN